MVWPIAVLIGFAIGAVMGGLGGGGAILAVPVLVYLLGQEPTVATTGSLLIVAGTAVSGVASHHRSVNWRVGLSFAGIGIVGSIVGSLLSARVSPEVLMFGFAALLLLVAGVMLLQAQAPQPALAAATAAPPALRVALAAVSVGLLTGFFGVGGGFAIVPALTLLLGMPMATAIATSILIIGINALVGLTVRAFDHGLSVDWPVIGLFTLFALLGSFVGAKFSHRLPARTLQRAFAVLLVAIAFVILLVRY